MLTWPTVPRHSPLLTSDRAEPRCRAHPCFWAPRPGAAAPTQVAGKVAVHCVVVAPSGFSHPSYVRPSCLSRAKPRERNIGVFTPNHSKEGGASQRRRSTSFFCHSRMPDSSRVQGVCIVKLELGLFFWGGLESAAGSCVAFSPRRLPRFCQPRDAISSRPLPAIPSHSLHARSILRPMPLSIPSAVR